MALAAGTRLGPCEILSAIGAGGMGEVYRARDTRLDRIVAVKIVPELFVHDPERLARFEREAKTLAALNHPHIAQIYGIEQTGATSALVMELVEGEDLAERLARGAIPVDEALQIALQIAEALEAAHDQGIIHRDLKPANVKLRPDGIAKVLDFGLAKAVAPPDRVVDTADSPTFTVAATQMGTIVGTAAYMAPEQARGKVLDKRADIWAFGCVLYEMLAGTPVFGGDTVMDIVASVVQRDPDWARLPPGTPASVRRLLRRCLEKDPRSRLRDIGDARLELLGDSEAIAGSGSAPDSSPRLSVVASGLAAVLGAALAVVVLLWAPWRTAPPADAVRLQVHPGADVSLATHEGAAAILSPDGKLLAFAGQKRGSRSRALYVRRLDQLSATMLPDTDGAHSPFFSPDGGWIAFFAGGKLRKVPAGGGAAVTVAEMTTDGRGGSWADDDTIVFTPSYGEGVRLLRVAAGGGTPQPLIDLADNEVTQRWPQVLPGGRSVLFTSNTSVLGFDKASIVVQRLPAGERKILVRGGSYGRYLPSGHLVYVQGGSVFAAPFDLGRLEFTGPVVTMFGGITHNLDRTGGAQLAFSETGTLVYLAGGSVRWDLVPIAWIQPEGQATPMMTPQSIWSNLRFSPDGKRLALRLNRSRGGDIWTYENERAVLSRLTFDMDGSNPVWTRDGARIAFAAREGSSAFNLYWQRSEGTTEAQRLTDGPRDQYPTSWHPDGGVLAFQEAVAANNFDLMLLPVGGGERSGWRPGKPVAFVSTRFNEGWARFSPDGRWIAYASNESGRFEVYVRPYPAADRKYQVSTDGGMFPQWSPTRRELVYARPDHTLATVPYAIEEDAFRPGKPRAWSHMPYHPGFGPVPSWRFDLHPDGERVAMAMQPEASGTGSPESLVFVFNFFDELKRVAPAKQR